jgi:hypothetical protein
MTISRDVPTGRAGGSAEHNPRIDLLSRRGEIVFDWQLEPPPWIVSCIRN